VKWCLRKNAEKWKISSTSLLWVNSMTVEVKKCLGQIILWAKLVSLGR